MEGTSKKIDIYTGSQKTALCYEVFFCTRVKYNDEIKIVYMVTDDGDRGIDGCTIHWNNIIIIIIHIIINNHKNVNKTPLQNWNQQSGAFFFFCISFVFLFTWELYNSFLPFFSQVKLLLDHISILFQKHPASSFTWLFWISYSIKSNKTKKSKQENRLKNKTIHLQQEKRQMYIWIYNKPIFIYQLSAH